MKKAEAGRAIYVYGIIRQDALDRPPSQVPEGVPGATKTRILRAGSKLGVVIADVPLPEYSSQEIEARLQDLDHVSRAALGHQRIVERFMQEATIIPMKLFTLFSSEARVIEEIGGHRRELLASLARLEGREEWGVRLSFNEAEAVERRASARRSSASPAASAGASFLQRKKEQRDVRREARAEATSQAQALYEQLSLDADDAAVRPAPAAGARTNVLLEAAFLVKRAHRDRFSARVEQQASRLAELGHDVQLTGPWPPYTFVSRAS